MTSTVPWWQSAGAMLGAGAVLSAGWRWILLELVVPALVTALGTEQGSRLWYLRVQSCNLWGLSTAVLGPSFI